MYRVADMVRATRTALSEDLVRQSQQRQQQLGLRLLHHSCACQKKHKSPAPRHSQSAPPPPAPAPLASPPRVDRPKRLASDLGSPAAIARFEALVASRKDKSTKRREERAERLADGRPLPMYMWKRLPPEQRWAHLREGLFPLAEATSPASASSASSLSADAAAAAVAAAAPSSSSLLTGLSRSSNLFSSRATIHRIIGFESDLILESKRDNMLSAEVALVGRSNVGKSSLLNALLVNGGLRKQLATTSKTPGRTQQLFMFSFERDRNVRVVDCPGYGYAQASLKRVAGWNALMGTYLRKRFRQGILKRVLVLVDARRGIGPLDEKFMQFLEGAGIAYQIVLTKVDKMGPLQFESTLQEIRKHLQAMPQGIFKTAAKRREYEKRMEKADAEEAREAKADAAAAAAAAGTDGATVAESSPKEESAATFVEGSGQPAPDSGPPMQPDADEDEDDDDDDDLPAFSCSIPLIHVVSAREKVGIVALQNALTKMLHHEPNLRGRQYEPEGSEEGAEVGRLASGLETIDAQQQRQARDRFLPPGSDSLDGAEGADGEDGPFVLEAADDFGELEDDGMDNHPLAATPDDDGMDNAYEEAEIEEQFIPPIPVAHYDLPTEKDRARLRAQRRNEMEQAAAAFSSSPKRGAFNRGGPSRRPGSPGRFKRSFSTSTTLFAARKPRAVSPATAPAAAAAPASADASPEHPKKAARKPSKPRSSKAKAAKDSDVLPAEDESAAAPKKKAAAKPRAAAKKKANKQAPSVDAAATETSVEAPVASAAVADIVEADSDPSVSAAVSSASVPSSSSDAHLGAIYQKKSQREHILARSETYIGSMHHQHSFQWVYAEDRSRDGSTLERRKVVQKECVFVPSLVHIFDEILVNAADNQHRVSAAVDSSDSASASAAPQTMTSIRVTLDAATGRISVQNDGASIPVAMHPTERIPIPELIFGHLLTSSNYDDTQQRFTGGRHGFGAKLTNIFSREFKVEIQDVARGRRFEQTFRDNMGARSPAQITSFQDLLSSKQAKAKDLQRNYTRISFLPDFARFSEKGLTPDTLAIMKKRVLDVAACVNTNIAVEKGAEKTRRKLNPNADPASTDDATASVKKIKVYLNDELVDVDSFPKYLDLFPAPGGAKGAAAASDGDEDAAEESEVPSGKWVFGNINSKWQIAVGPNVATAAPPASSNAAAAAAALGAANVSVLSAATRDISFVNSICTSRGGTHVTHVSDKIVRALIDHILRAHKDISREMLPSSLVRSHMSLLVNCKIPNPSFSSQTKESLMTPAKDFGSECTLSNAFLNQVTASATGIVPAIVEAVKQKHMVDLLRKQRATAALSKRGRQLQIPKLEDAHWAGSSDASKVAQTTLILTEGDSAKALVLSSLAILGREKYGVFPLKGKLLNVRDASLKAVMDNAEIQNILTIVGLEIGAKYEATEGVSKNSGERAARPLRYGRIMLMTDQDHDGSHIKGLLINLLHHFWPELLRRNNFLEEFVTAIIKVKDQRSKITKQFHTIAAFEAWKASLPPALLASPEKLRRAYTIKYYKGLGTNTTEEGKEYFRNIAQHRVRFIWDAANTAATNAGAAESGVTAKIAEKVLKGRGYTHARQVEAAVQALEHPASSSSLSLLPAPSSSDPGAWINLAFSKSQADARKEWLRTYFSAAASSGVDTSSGQLRYKDFINRELIVFSHADNIRSIPSVLDGLKPVQRKILYGCFKRRDLSSRGGEIKVAQLSGYISEQTGYHHGEASLQSSIISMAQSFTGSGNNIALLRGLGQFGSRNTGGKDAAAPRYIFTALSPLTRLIFPAADDALLSYKDEDGLQVEPEYFVPILPLVLVNGAEGIGTGFSTTVPTYNPRDIVEQIRARLTNNGRTNKLHPWVRGFVGEIAPVRSAAAESAASASATNEGEDESFMSSNSSASSFDAAEPISRYITSGRITELPPSSSSSKSSSSSSGNVIFEITELPLGRWLEDYKSSFLSSLLSDSRIRKFVDLSSDETIRLQVHAAPEQADEIRTKGLSEFFKLTSMLQMGNMHLFSSGGAIAKYPDAESILAEFMAVRAEFYRRRKEYSELILGAELDRARNKIRFVESIMNDSLRVYKQAKSVLVSKLIDGGFKTAAQLLPRIPIYADHTQRPPIKFLNETGSPAAAAGTELTGAQQSQKEVESDAFDYLLNMPLSALTAERLASLQSEHDQVAAQLASLQRATPAQLWLEDLDKFEQAWNKEMDRKSDGKSKRSGRKMIEDEAEEDNEGDVAEAEIQDA